MYSKSFSKPLRQGLAFSLTMVAINLSIALLIKGELDTTINYLIDGGVAFSVAFLISFVSEKRKKKKQHSEL